MDRLADRFARHRSLRRRLAVLGVLAVLAIPMGIAMAGDGSAPFTLVEADRGFNSLQEAVNAIGDGRGTIRVAPGRWEQCAVQTAGDVAYVAAVPGQATLARAACEGKAGLVLRGRSARVEGLIFENYAVADGNGAGIRLEHGDLAVREAWFRDSEEGILTGNDADHAIVIEQSTFSRLGRCDRGLSCAHSVYVGDYGALTVRRVRFEAGRGGHYLKSRAGKVDVSDSSFDDSHGRTTNYMIDLPAGATGRIANNWFVQGRDKENYSAFIAVAAEGKVNPSDGLAIAGNDARFGTGIARESTFVADWSGDAIAIGTNRLGAGLKVRDKR